MFRVLILTTEGAPMLYRDFPHLVDALDWQAWAESSLPCIARLESSPCLMLPLLSKPLARAYSISAHSESAEFTSFA